MKKHCNFSTLFLFAASALLVLSTSCKKEQPAMSTFNEGCDCAQEVSAAFEILELEEPPNFNPIGTDTDTIYNGKNVIFRAKEENAEYTWYIGSEILSGKQVGRYFSSAFSNQDVTVSLVVKKKPNSICLPNDDGYDSITRVFHVQPYWSCNYTTEYTNGKTLMEGTYRMKSAALPDSFDVFIDYIDRQTANGKEIDFYNLDGQGTNFIGHPRCMWNTKNYRQIWSNSGNYTNYGFLQGTFHYRLDGVAEFKFTTRQGSQGNWTIINHHLLGRKIN